MEILIISYWDFQEKGIAGLKKTPIYFAERGNNINVFVHSEMTTNPTPLDDMHPNIEIHRFNIPFKFLLKIPKIKRIRQLLFFCLYCLYKYNKIYKKGKRPDVLYAVECDAILIGSLMSKLYKIPLIARHYGVSRYQLKRPFRHFLYHLSLSRWANLKIVSDDGTGGLEVLKKRNPRIERIESWRDGLEPAIINNTKIFQIKQNFGIKDSDFIILTVSRFISWKRVDRALKVISFIKKKGIVGIKLLIVGHGPLESKLRNLARELKISRDVIFVGSVKHKDIYNYYKIADIFLSLYDYSNLGNPIFEALMSGKCIVTLNNGKTGEVIKAGLNGVILDLNKSEESLIENLGKKINELLINEKYRKKLEKGAKDYARRNLKTWDERLKAEMESIEKVVKQSTAGKLCNYEI